VNADVDLYCARHTFGTDAIDATKNQFQVMKIRGHTTLKTTGRYQHHETAGMGKLLEEARSLRLRHNLGPSGQNEYTSISVSN
jgi:integrase